jgi:hypothetical protein
MDGSGVSTDQLRYAERGVEPANPWRCGLAEFAAAHSTRSPESSLPTWTVRIEADIPLLHRTRRQHRVRRVVTAKRCSVFVAQPASVANSNEHT